MREPWDERSDGGTVEIAFEGFDAAKRDDEEAREFVGTVTKRQDVSVWLMGRWVPMSPMVVGLIVLGALLAYGAARFVAPTTGVMLVAFLVPFLVAGLVAASRRKTPGIETERFTLRLEAAGLSVTGGRSGVRTLSLSEIDRFEGGERLMVVKSDGTREALSCSLLAESRHVELAARLDEVLRSVRASAAGYRGARIAPSADEEEEEAEAEAENAAVARRE